VTELAATILEVVGSAGLGAADVTIPPTKPGPLWIGLIPALPLLGVVLCTLCAIFKVKGKLPAWLTVGCLAASFVLTLLMYMQFSGLEHHTVSTAFRWFDLEWESGGGRNGPRIAGHLIADFGFYIDSLTCLWMLFVTGLATLIALYASEYMAHDVGKGYSRFFAAFSLFVFSMACLVMADNFLLLYLGWEGVGLCSYLLIGYFYKKPSAVAAAKKAFIMNRIGDLGLALGIFLIFVKFGTVEYAELFKNEQFRTMLRHAVAGHFDQVPWDIQLIPMLLMVGAFGKSAQFPLYVWLPDAMEGPTPVSALIHAATMVTAGVFLIARTFQIFQLSEHALTVVAIVGTVTAFLAATIGMAQFDIKRIMAYSTVSQLGYMFAGLGVLTSTGAAFHVFTHAFFKALLFLACGAVMHGFAGQLDLRKLSGVQKMPGWRIVGITMLVGCINLAGFPGTAGFWSKDMILAQAFVTPGMSMVGWVLLLTAGMTAYYTFRVYFRVFMGPREYHPGDELHSHDDEAHDGHGHAGHDHAKHGDAHAHKEEAHDFHPHPPGWAIKLVLVLLAIASFAVIPLNFTGKHSWHGGWVAGMVETSTANWPAPGEHHEKAGGESHSGDGHSHAAGESHAAGHDHKEHGTFLGQDPHKVMYYVSAVVGLFGIAVAYWLHLAGRTSAERSRADELLPILGPIPTWAQNKWYVDELYHFLFVRPLWVLSHIFHLLDRMLVDGSVNLAGILPRALGATIRPSQSGHLHGYAVAMAGGIALLLLIVLVVVAV
jgi:NADH-quinone oxidoreductase subunit L